ncbi:MAG: LysM peptidoglycan-binding domain-containing protein [Actinomycetales bacterium]
MPQRARLRITRRGRLCLTMAVMVCAVGLAIGLGGAAAVQAQLSTLTAAVVNGDGAGSVSAPAQRVRVLPGQTLWQIAVERRPERDPRDVVVELRELNGLQTSQVRAGQELVLPD